ncbi:MAG: C45 family autoproteolytic acyltransferase/hydrolase [Candidatus Odinarchaeota archaeon]
MFQVKLKGSYYDMGFEQGKELKKGGFVPPPSSERRFAFASECEQLAKKYIPGILEELRGIADSGDYDYDQLKALPLCLGYYLSPPPKTESCSVIALSGNHTASGKPLFIRNYDWDIESEQWFTAYWTHPENGLPSLGFCDFHSSRYGGVNEGIAIAISSSNLYKYPIQPGVSMNLATRWVLDHCSTTKEAVTFLKKVPHVAAFNFLIADKNNGIARVEASPKKVHVIHYDEGFAVSTNHYLSDEMKELEVSGDENPNGSSESRVVNAKKWFENRQGPVTTEYARELAKDHENGVCDHFVYEGTKGGTIWSWIYTLGELEMIVAPGSPCKTEFLTVQTAFE